MRTMPIRSFRNAALTTTALALASAAHTAPAVDFTLFSPEQHAQMANVLAKQRSRQGAEYNYDTRPAVLKSISVGQQVKANLKGAQAVVSLKATDNMTGVYQVMLTLMSPSGRQYANGSWNANYEYTREELQIGVDMSHASENGLWRVYSVSVADANYNTSIYDEAMLAALGRTTFTVSGALGDVEAPVVEAGGVNLTPAVSLSTPPRGMQPGTDPRIGAQLRLSDPGGAGVHYVVMTFCKDGVRGDCIYLRGGPPLRGQTALTLTVGGEAYRWVAPGNYFAHSLSINDFAGNYRNYDVDSGDDLSSLLDNPVIVLTE